MADSAAQTVTFQVEVPANPELLLNFSSLRKQLYCSKAYTPQKLLLREFQTSTVLSAFLKLFLAGWCCSVVAPPPLGHTSRLQSCSPGEDAGGSGRCISPPPSLVSAAHIRLKGLSLSADSAPRPLSSALQPQPLAPISSKGTRCERVSALCRLGQPCQCLRHPPPCPELLQGEAEGLQHAPRSEPFSSLEALILSGGRFMEAPSGGLGGQCGCSPRLGALGGWWEGCD